LCRTENHGVGGSIPPLGTNEINKLSCTVKALPEIRATVRATEWQRRWGVLKMKPILAGLLLSAVAVFAVIPTAGWAKTVKECEAEWHANKAAIQASGQTKKDFVAAYRAEAATAPAPTTAAPRPAPNPESPIAPPGPSRVPASRAAPTKSGEFTTEAEAKAKCPSDTVVWCNTNSGVYHYAGTHNYGHTR
jgi:hypothetical protein